MRYIAADFGAGSGRIIVGTRTDANAPVYLEEIHRFENNIKLIDNHLRWDFHALFKELKTGLKKAFAKYGDEIKSIGIDTWGVDYGLLDKNGKLIANPICYRDNRTHGMIQVAFQHLHRDDFFKHAANQFMEINTVFQLLSAVTADDEDLKNAETLLFMPDLFNYFLTGKCYNEFTVSSTSQLLNSHSHQWDDVIFEKLSLPKRLTFIPEL